MRNKSTETKVFRILKEAARGVSCNRLRSSLAVLGMIVGVASVVAMVAVGRKGESRILAEIERLGTNTLVVNAGSSRFLGRRRRSSSKVTTLTLDDARTIKTQIEGVVSVSPREQKGGKARFRREIVNTTISGVSTSYFNIMGTELKKGRIFEPWEERRLRRVAVLGSELAVNLSAGKPVIDQTINVRKIPFKVLGVLKKRGVDAFGNDQDNQLFVPITTMLKRVLNQTHIGTIIISVEKGRDLTLVRQQITELLRYRHNLAKTNKDNDFTVSTISELLSGKEKATRMFSLLITSVASISLIVAGIGIMAVMLISVQERTMEIGLRRAVGATRKDLLLQFLFEAMLLGFGGGSLGAITGIMIAWSVKATNKYPLGIPYRFAFGAMLFAVVISLFFGVFPARRAANLSPISALAKE